MLQQASVLEKELYLNPILSQIHEAVLFINLDGRITLLNAVAQTLFKIDDKVLSRPFWEIFPNDAFGFPMKEALLFGNAPKCLYKQEMEIKTLFCYEGPKAAHGLLLIIQDMREKAKKLLGELRDQRMRALGEMTAIVAHEIRNPLGGMRGYASLLLRDLADTPHLQEMAGFIIEGTKALEKMVSAVLQYSKPFQIQPQTMDVCRYLKEIGRFIRADPSFPPNIKFMLHIPDAPLLAPIDPEAMKGALLNLSFNAFQAMQAGGVLTWTLLQREGSYQIAVTDTGIGMNEEQLQSLFVPFYTTKKKGNGLGLVEVQKTIQAHLGTIEVRSQVGLGSTFTITLPLKR